MSKWRIPIIQDEGTFLYWFECSADDLDHALDQAEDALCEGEILGTDIVQLSV